MRNFVRIAGLFFRQPLCLPKLPHPRSNRQLHHKLQLGRRHRI